MVIGLIIAAVVLVLDQVSKWWMMSKVLVETDTIVVTSFFNLVKAWNTGVSFSMFNNWGGNGVIALSILALVIILVLLYWLYNEDCKCMQVCLGMIIGGAIGNVIDRIRFGAVFDFLDFHIGVRHWPAFNVADTFICIGAVVIILYSMFIGVEEKEESGE